MDSFCTSLSMKLAFATKNWNSCAEPSRGLTGGVGRTVPCCCLLDACADTAACICWRRDARIQGRDDNDERDDNEEDIPKDIDDDMTTTTTTKKEEEEEEVRWDGMGWDGKTRRNSILSPRGGGPGKKREPEGKVDEISPRLCPYPIGRPKTSIGRSGLWILSSREDLHTSTRSCTTEQLYRRVLPLRVPGP